jgi:hypothetical protein
MNQEEDQFDFPDMETEIVASAPSRTSPEESKSEEKEIQEPIKINQKPEPETVEVSEETKKRVLQLVKPQESKYNHFQFKSQADTDKLTNVLQSIPGHNITVSYGIPQSTPDISLSENGQIVGKIHLLLCDRRDANKPEKYYVKLYLYHFTDLTLQETVKSALLSFFESFYKQSNKQGNKNNTTTPAGGKRNKNLNKKRITRKRNLKSKSHNRKKTNKR